MLLFLLSYRIIVVAWVSEQTGIYADGKLDIYVGRHTQLDGSVLYSDSGELTLDTGTLGFTTIRDHDRGSAFDMTVGMSVNTLAETPWSWLTAQNGSGSSSTNQSNGTGNNLQTGSPAHATVSGSISNHDREQDTNATVGAGTIVIRDQANQQQDVAALNRDITQAQVITKDESSGVDFYMSDSGLEAITNPVQYSQQVLANFERQLDQWAALGGHTASQLKEAARNGTLNEDTVRQLRNCGGSQSGFNFWNLFVTTAHADESMCYVSIGGKDVAVPKGEAKNCADAIEAYLKENGRSIFVEYVEERSIYKGQGLTGNEKAYAQWLNTAMGLGDWSGKADIQAGNVGAAYYYDDSGQKVYVTNEQGQYLYVNQNTGQSQWYNPNLKNTLTGYGYPTDNQGLPMDGVAATPIYSSDPMDQYLAGQKSAVGAYFLTLPFSELRAAGSSSVLNSLKSIQGTASGEFNEIWTATVSTGQRLPAVDFYITPSGAIIPSTGYRVIGGKAADLTISTGVIGARLDGTYITFTNISKLSGLEAKSVL